MKLIRRLVKSFWFGNYDSDTFHDLRKEIIDTNLFLMKRVSMAFIIITTLPFVISLFVEALSSARIIYATIMMVSILVQILCRTFLLRHSQGIIPVYLIYYVSLTGIAVILGVLSRVSVPTVVICVLLAIMPVFILDKPGKIALVSLLPVTAYCIATLQIKNSDIALIECLNCVTSCAVGFFVGRHFTNTKMEEIITRNQLEKISETDSLTNLYTRGAIEKKIYQHLTRRHSISAMMLMDIDDFKQINDTFGHQYGDKLLTDVASALKGAFRSTDFISRLGGDEFIAFLPSIPSKEWMEFKAGQVVDLIHRSYTHDGKTRGISASMGIAFSENGQGTYDELYKNADRAMYEAKHAGKNRFCLFGGIPNP